MAGAVAAGWLVPGVGHVILGRVRRGVLFAALIFASFGLGLANDGRLALRDPAHPVLTSLQVVANAGVGIADMFARAAVYGQVVYALPRNVGLPEYQKNVTILRDRVRSGRSTYGTAYLWTAGLMNLLLLFDVWDIGRGRKD